MSRVAYVNGRYRPLPAAAVNVEDRGYQFGDGVYEVIYVHEHRLIDIALHLTRLRRSLDEIKIDQELAALPVVLREVVRRNRVRTGLVYTQITRGVARRDHGFPLRPVRPSLVVTARHGPALPADPESWAVQVITAPDQRWARCDIKSTNLLPNVLAKQAARQSGAFEAVLYDDQDFVTEGASTTVWIVDAAGVLRTRQLDRHILPGCTRAALLTLTAACGMTVAEGAFQVAALRTAREVFLTSATAFVRPVTDIDGTAVADGKIGPVTRMLWRQMMDHIAAKPTSECHSAIGYRKAK